MWCGRHRMVEDRRVNARMLMLELAMVMMRRGRRGRGRGRCRSFVARRRQLQDPHSLRAVRGLGVVRRREVPFVAVTWMRVFVLHEGALRAQSKDDGTGICSVTGMYLVMI